ncbi:MAG: hypothetical protein ACE3JU_26435 [Paenibacillus sp.]|uniref:hypothetical protein n=1 Tax=Paenibacillus sp. TaxID=58172 RepID=UPI003B7E792D
MCFAWQDNGIVTGISTIHDPEAEFIVRARRRPKNPNTSVADAFGEFTRRWLPIPKIIDDYNKHMNGVDQADQLRTYMTTHRKGRWVWLPIFWWLLDTAAGNAFILYRLHALELRQQIPESEAHLREKSHRDWMEHVAFGMIVDGFERMNGQRREQENIQIETILASVREREQSVWRNSGYSVSMRFHSGLTLPVERFDRPMNLHALSRQYAGAKAYCIWCTYKHDGTRKLAVGKPLQEVDDPESRTGKRVVLPRIRISQTRFYCEYCNVPLCNQNARGSGGRGHGRVVRQCFSEFHRLHHNL